MFAIKAQSNTKNKSIYFTTKLSLMKFLITDKEMAVQNGLDIYIKKMFYKNAELR